MPETTHNPVTLDELIAAGRNFASPQETASILHVDVRTIRTACQLGEIPNTKAGVQYRIPVAWLRRAADPEAAAAVVAS